MAAYVEYSNHYPAEAPCCEVDDVWGDCMGECGCEACLPAPVAAE